MKRQAQGIRSTKKKVKEAMQYIEYDRDINPPRVTEKANHLFIAIGTLDKKDGTIYADLTGNLSPSQLSMDQKPSS
eukprot:scaffold308299_cov29-Attheya_sp.AAC.1